MLRTYLSTSLLAIALWSVALSAAEAQFIGLPFTVELDGYINMTYSGRTQVECQESFPSPAAW